MGFETESRLGPRYKKVVEFTTLYAIDYKEPQS